MQDLKHWVDKIWMNDAELQREFLKVLISDVRKVSDADIQREDLEMFEKLGMFYVPDDDYLRVVIGEEATRYGYGVYRSGLCTIAERVAIPMWTPSGQVIGFIGYSNSGTESTVEIEDTAGSSIGQSDLEETDLFGDGSGKETKEDYESEIIAATGRQAGVLKYLYPPSFVMSKGSYIYCHPDWIAKGLQDGYVCITDGIFGAIRLNQIGVNALSLCGSMLTEWHKLYLRMFDKVIVVYDNDNAGVRLAQTCCEKLNNCYRFSFTGFKDIDDFLKLPENIERFKHSLNELIETGFEQGVLRSVTLPGSGMTRFNSNLWQDAEDEVDKVDEVGETDEMANSKQNKVEGRHSDGKSQSAVKKAVEVEETEWQKEQVWSKHMQDLGRDARERIARVNKLNFLMVEVDEDRKLTPDEEMLKEAIKDSTERAVKRSRKIPNRQGTARSSFLSSMGDTSNGKTRKE